MKNSYDINFYAPDVHFDNLYLLSDPQAEKIGNLKCYDSKDSLKTQNKVP
jgi:hypothetical protein